MCIFYTYVVVCILCEALQLSFKRYSFGFSQVYIALFQELSVEDVFCPVTGGHSEETAVPVLSQCIPPVDFNQARMP